MIGAEPNSGWLFGTVRLDKKGFILTGGADGFESTPYATSVPGIFAVGDVRSKSVKRVASAVGEGSVVISDVHRYLADHRNSFAVEPNSALAALRSASAAVDLRSGPRSFENTIVGQKSVRRMSLAKWGANGSYHPCREAPSIAPLRNGSDLN